jgi:hypothetical protein
MIVVILMVAALLGFTIKEKDRLSFILPISITAWLYLVIRIIYIYI